MSAEDLLGLLVPATYLYFLLTESPWPARSFPPRKGWQWLGVGFLLLMMTIGTVLPLALPVDWLATHRLLDGTRLGVVGGAIVGYVVLEGVIYARHRSVHTFDVMWRGFHQIHHSPDRVDIPGSTLFHPTEVVAQTMLQLGCTVFVLGLEPLAAGIVGCLISFNTFFQHWTVRTPQWLAAMLAFRDVNAEFYPAGSLGQQAAQRPSNA